MKINFNYALIVLILIVLALLRAKRNYERYESQDENIDMILKAVDDKGMVKLITYDEKATYDVRPEIDSGKYLKLVTKGDDGKERYISIVGKDTIHNTNTKKPLGEYRFKLKKALNGDDRFFSLALKDTDRYVFLDPTNNTAGVADLTGKSSIGSVVYEPKSLNLRLSK
jgi:hypothetical protein